MRGFVEKSWLPSIITHNRAKLQKWLRGSENKIIVHEEAGVRSLYFSAGKVQSSMRTSDPIELVLGYTMTMMGFLLFMDEPKNILIVGLGGGSLSKYCYRQFSQARITTLEINREVIGLRDCFLVPHDDERFQVVHADAADYLERSDIQADIILLDGFAADGLPEGLSSESFLWQLPARFEPAWGIGCQLCGEHLPGGGLCGSPESRIRKSSMDQHGF